MAYPDSIVRYVTKAKDGKVLFCRSCKTTRYVWVGDTEGGERLTGCANCQYVIKREPVPKENP